MHCPMCKTTVLQQHELEAHLSAQQCQECEGHWIPASEYREWLSQRKTTAAEDQTEDQAEQLVPVSPADTKTAKICPDCQHILLRCRVGHGLNFGLDRCTHCGGMWLARNEWAALKSHHLHGSAHVISSAVWQRKIQEQERSIRTEHRLERLLGDLDYAEIKRIKAWVDTHPKREHLMGFLRNH